MAGGQTDNRVSRAAETELADYRDATTHVESIRIDRDTRFNEVQVQIVDRISARITW